jgi:acetylornithine deacetylase/succinyl-diaminopimelate desuccinylase-like protein
LTSRFSEAAKELFDFLRIPSISARSEHKQDVAAAAEWLAQKLIAAGLSAEIVKTDGHPIVLGEYRGAGPSAPTYLVYGHYDVQPVEPLELWTSPPFEPTVRDGRIYARGSVDDKGQLYLHVKALQAHLSTQGMLPVNVIVLAEGEEEVGSANLPDFVATASSSRTRRCSRRVYPRSSSRFAGCHTCRSTSTDRRRTCIRAAMVERL